MSQMVVLVLSLLRFLYSQKSQNYFVLPVLTDMHVPTLARMLYVLQLLVLDLCELLVNSLFYPLCIALQPHTSAE